MSDPSKKGKIISINGAISLSDQDVDFTLIMSILKNTDSIKELNLIDCRVFQLPYNFGDLNSLEIINLNGNNLKILPDSFIKLKKLEKLNLSDNDFRHIPNFIVGHDKHFPNLIEVDFRNNKLNYRDRDLLRWIHNEQINHPNLQFLFDKEIYGGIPFALERKPFDDALYEMDFISLLVEKKTDKDYLHAWKHLEELGEQSSFSFIENGEFEEFEYYRIIDRFLKSKGELLEYFGKNDEAIKLYDDIHDSFGDRGPLIKKGDLLLKLDQFDDAMKCYDAAIEIDPTYEYPLYHKAHMLFHVKRLDEAEELCDRALELNYEIPMFEIFNLKHRILVEYGHYEDALPWLDKLSEAIKSKIQSYADQEILEPQLTDAIVSKIMILSYLDRVNEGLELTNYTIINVRDDHRLWSLKAEFLSQLERYEEAELAYERSLELERDPKIMYLFALSLIDDSKVEKAKKILRKALEIDPNNVDVQLLSNSLN